jgi:hypothetical protein
MHIPTGLHQANCFSITATAPRNRGYTGAGIYDPQARLHISQFSIPDQPPISCLIPTMPRKPKEAL